MLPRLMSGDQRARERVSRSAAAFEVMLDNLGTASNPHRGNLDKAAEMREIIKAGAAQARAEQDAEEHGGI